MNYFSLITATASTGDLYLAKDAALDDAENCPIKSLKGRAGQPVLEHLVLCCSLLERPDEVIRRHPLLLFKILSYAVVWHSNSYKTIFWKIIL